MGWSLHGDRCREGCFCIHISGEMEKSTVHHRQVERPVDESWNVNRKELEKDIVFFMHVTMTYDNFDPLFEGFLLDSEPVARQEKQGGLEKGSGGLEGHGRLVVR